MPKDEWQTARNRDAARRAKQPPTEEPQKLTKSPGLPVPLVRTGRREKYRLATEKKCQVAARCNESWTDALRLDPEISFAASVTTGQVMRATLKKLRVMQQTVVQPKQKTTKRRSRRKNRKR